MDRIWQEPIAILGFGAEGQSTLRFLKRLGYTDLLVLDRQIPSEPMPPGVNSRFGLDYLSGLKMARTAFRSPGIRPFEPEIQEFIKRGGVLTSQLEAAISLVGRNRVLGVTGTLGKGTCCSLLSAMLEKGSIPHRLAGNIGVPVLDTLQDLGEKEWLLLELSSFQLSTLRQSPYGAIVLRTTTEHLDWHSSQAEYWDHKANISRHQKVGDFCVYFADAPGSAWIGPQGLGRKISVGEASSIRITENEVLWPEKKLRLRLDETQLVGSFNLENLAGAAAAALELGVSPLHILEAARKFIPLEHRLEFVASLQGVKYFNDSYATRPEATLAAVRALNVEPLGLILGGSEKNADFSELASGLAGEPQLRAMALLGATAERLESELRRSGAFKERKHRICGSLEEAMDFLRSEILSGVILLSPACASFGLFSNYKQRGLAFKTLVRG